MPLPDEAPLDFSLLAEVMCAAAIRSGDILALDRSCGVASLGPRDARDDGYQQSGDCRSSDRESFDRHQSSSYNAQRNHAQESTTMTLVSSILDNVESLISWVSSHALGADLPSYCQLETAIGLDHDDSRAKQMAAMDPKGARPYI